MRLTYSAPAQAAAGYILMVSAFSAALASTLLFFLPRFADLYSQAGLSVPFLTAVFITHRGTAVGWFGALGCLFAFLPLTRLFRRGPTSVLVLYTAVVGAIALSVCIPLIELLHRVG
jgi:type II secretory pathway component PulF